MALSCNYVDGSNLQLAMAAMEQSSKSGADEPVLMTLEGLREIARAGALPPSGRDKSWAQFKQL